MFLTPLWDADNTSAVWQVYAVSDETKCQVVDALEQWVGDRSMRAHAHGIFAVINHLTTGQMSPDQLLRSGGLCHEAVKGTRIFRIRKGVIRLYWFYGEEQKVIICPHVETKRQDVVSSSTKKILIRAQDEYKIAFDRQEIVIVNNGENHE